MDLHNQLSKNMDDIVKMFESRMNQFDKMLSLSTQAQGSTKPPTTTFGDFSSLASDYAAFKDVIWKSLSMLRQQLQLLSVGFDMQEARSRSRVLLFHGLPESTDEQVESKIQSVLHNQLKLTSIDSSQLDIFRLGTKKEKPRPILVRFIATKHRNLVWNSKTSLKGSGVTISEFLTKPRQELFVAARKHFGLKNCWTSDEVIIVALPDKSRKKILTSAELKDLCEKFPQVSSAPDQKTRSRRVKVTTK
ncbi:protein unc-13 homolog C-like [Vanessa atalanta]|uniref:protein unc-13 homolog C-like n=1 Tax=Vanessa atalanta TaxID=42275 RepID=UPI001FCD1D2D|nr:protein unc-13 homolog C-like [Vanessa atalanta]